MITPHNLEYSMSRAKPDRGYAEQRSYPITSLFSVTDNTCLTGSTNPKVTTDEGSKYCVEWAFDADETKTILIADIMPDWWVDNDPASVGSVGGIDLILTARKYDTGADENSTLKLSAGLAWLNPSEAKQTLTTNATATLAASIATANSLGYADYTLKLGARLRAESKKIKRGASFDLTFGANTVVGTTNMKLQISGVRLAFYRHCGLGGDPARRIISG